jgi:predicted Zn-dependent peptidase
MRQSDKPEIPVQTQRPLSRFGTGETLEELMRRVSEATKADIEAAFDRVFKEKENSN